MNDMNVVREVLTPEQELQREGACRAKHKDKEKTGESLERGERSRFLLFSTFTLQINQSRLERKQKQQRTDAEG